MNKTLESKRCYYGFSGSGIFFGSKDLHQLIVHDNLCTFELRIVV
jgi:hypothetical protein